MTRVSVIFGLAVTFLGAAWQRQRLLPLVAGVGFAVTAVTAAYQARRG